MLVLFLKQLITIIMKDTLSITKVMPEIKEDILWTKLGSFGRWQLGIFILTGISTIFEAMHDFDYIYIAAVPDYWCNIPELENSTWSLGQIQNISMPLHTVNGASVYNPCSQYVRNYSSIKDLPFADAYKQVSKQIGTTACTDWTYDKSIYESTLVTEWNLVCDKRALVPTIQSVFLAGILVSCITCGILSDKIGRKPVINGCIVLWLLVAVVQVFCNNYISYVIFRFLLGIFSYGVYLVGFVLLTETVGVSYRAAVGILYQVPFSIGFMIIPGISYLIRDWQSLQYFFSFSNIPVLIIIWFIPESPRWLIVNGRLEEAKKLLRVVADRNRKIISDDEIQDIVNLVLIESKSEYSSTDETYREKCLSVCHKVSLLGRTAEMLKRTIFSFFAWFVVSLMYYGLSLNGINLPFNPYLVTFIMATIELPAEICIIPLIDFCGRRSITCATLIVAGVACLLQMAPPAEMDWLVTVFAAIGKLCITATFAIIYLYQIELFPTEIRNIGIGGASIFARVGAISSPYIIDLLGVSNRNIPIIIFGVTGLVAGVTSAFLPETSKRKLPDTVAEIEIIKREQKNNNS